MIESGKESRFSGRLREYVKVFQELVGLAFQRIHTSCSAKIYKLNFFYRCNLLLFKGLLGIFKTAVDIV